MYIFVSQSELCRVTVLALLQLRYNFCLNLEAGPVFLPSALTEEKKLFQPWIYSFPCLIARNALRGGVVSMFLEENINV